MRFRTIVEVSQGSEKISYEDPVLILGSCFAQHIIQKLSYYKFPHCGNPFGLLYNPASINNAFEILLDRKIFEENDIFYANGLWQSFFHHGKFSHPDKTACLQKINHSIDRAIVFLKKSKYCIITYGTAWIFENKTTGKVVANCHKLPHQRFVRKRLTVDQIARQTQKVISRIRSINPSLKFIFTVSPVRHWKDGPVENSLSKAILLLAIHKLISLLDAIYYFPSFEIMMDDLRDYRFYQTDMIHPNESAVDYIWSKFRDSFIHLAAGEQMNAIDKINKAINHKPLFPGMPVRKNQLSMLLNDIQRLKSKYPYLDFNNELNYIRHELDADG